MYINIPPHEQAKLAQLASAAGYKTVEAFVTEHILSLALDEVAAPAALSEAQLQASLAMCDQGMADIEAGQGRDAREVIREIGARHGFSLDR